RRPPLARQPSGVHRAAPGTGHRAAGLAQRAAAAGVLVVGTGAGVVQPWRDECLEPRRFQAVVLAGDPAGRGGGVFREPARAACPFRPPSALTVAATRRIIAIPASCN